MACDNESATAAVRRSRILVAEDNVGNFKLVEALLKRDYDLRHACHGGQAVEMFRAEGADLVLMDINMPTMDGYEAFEAIRALSADVPVIALTAYAFETDRQRIAAAGFTAFLPKPLRASELRAQIAALLADREQNTNL